MAETSREGALRMDQRIGESPDLWAIRAFVKAMPYMSQYAALAAVNYLYARSLDLRAWPRTRSDRTGQR